jgi:hypothetical protein
VARKKPALGRLPWLLPIAHLVHAVEEYWFGFPAWLNRLMGTRLTNERFIELNGFFLLAILLAVAIGMTVRPLRLVLAAVAAALVLNGIIHVGATVITGSYSPGAGTGLLLSIPVGLAVLGRLRRELARWELGAGVIAGVALHALATLGAVR